MKQKFSGVSALAVICALAIAPTSVLAGKGGVPNENGLANGKGSIHAHLNGKGDPNPEKGNDSAPATDDTDATVDDEPADDTDYEEVGAESADVEGEEEVEE